MKAQVLHKYDPDLSSGNWVSLEDVEDPKIEKSTDVVVRIGGAGVCRTDLHIVEGICCLLYTSPSPRDRTRSRMPSSA